MLELPLFDSLTHPTPNGNWLADRYRGTADAPTLVKEMQKHNVTHALAVGMGTKVGDYDEATYAQWVKQNIPGGLPVAFIDFDAADQDYQAYLEQLAALGYVGIKLHSRLSGVGFTDERLPKLITYAHQLGLVTLICTYNHGKEVTRNQTRLENALELLDAIGDAKVILLHGGVTNTLEWAEAVRTYYNVTLDLSFTLTRFTGSSLDLDIDYLFKNFDQRLCIGSDHPECSLGQMRERFDSFAKSISEEKARNIAFGNLAALFKIK